MKLELRIILNLFVNFRDELYFAFKLYSYRKNVIGIDQNNKYGIDSANAKGSFTSYVPLILAFLDTHPPRVISEEGSGGRSSIVKTFVHFGGSPPLKFLHWLSFSEFIDPASKVL